MTEGTSGEMDDGIEEAEDEDDEKADDITADAMIKINAKKKAPAKATAVKRGAAGDSSESVKPAASKKKKL